MAGSNRASGPVDWLWWPLAEAAAGEADGLVAVGAEAAGALVAGAWGRAVACGVEEPCLWAPFPLGGPLKAAAMGFTPWEECHTGADAIGRWLP